MQNVNNILKELVKEEAIVTTCISSLSQKVSRRNFSHLCTLNTLSTESKRNHRKVVTTIGRKLKEFEKRRRKKVNEEVKDKRTNQDLGRKRNTKIKRKRERDRNHNPPKAQVIVISIDLID